MAYSLESSSVKTIVPGAEVSGFADVVARQALSSQMSLSAGEGINFVEDAENHRTRIDLGLSAGSNMSLVYDQETNTIRLDAEGGGATYTGVAPIQVNNTTNEISISGETLSAGPGINLFSSAGYVVISAEGGNSFPITGTNGTTGFTANMNCSSFTITTGAGAAGAYIKQSTQGVQYEAYPATDVSASWLDLIRAANNINITCSAVKLTTGANEVRFETSALPSLNKITFIAPNYGPYGTYSALVDDGDTTFVSEVDSGCCRTVVKCWNDDRNKDCWCGLNQESYFYIG